MILSKMILTAQKENMNNLLRPVGVSILLAGGEFKALFLFHVFDVPVWTESEYSKAFNKAKKKNNFV